MLVVWSKLKQKKIITSFESLGNFKKWITQSVIWSAWERCKFSSVKENNPYRPVYLEQ